MTHINNKEGLTLPLGVVIAGALMALGIYMGLHEIARNGISIAQPGSAKSGSLADTKFTAVSSADHLRGNTGAKATLIEYTDLECPFCKQFHATIKSVLSKFVPGDVAWVYRPFPLSIHDRAPKEAQAAECAAEQGGNDKFWAFVDRVFEITPGNNRLDPNELPKVAAYVGLDVPAFQACLDSGKYQTKIDASIKDGLASGAAGTPYSLLITRNGAVQIKGSISADSLEQRIKDALR